MSRDARAPLARGSRFSARPHPRAAAVAALCLIALATLPAAVNAAKLVPEEPVFPVPIEIGGKVYSYVPLTAEQPLTVRVEGPVTFEAIARWRFVDDGGPIDVDVEVSLDGEPLWHHVIHARPGSATYPEEPDWEAGRSEYIVVDVEEGAHTVGLRLVRPVDGTLDLNLIERPPDILPWRNHWEGAFGMSYFSNVFFYSDADMDAYLGGERVDRYQFESLDDLRLEPALAMTWVREVRDTRATSIGGGIDWKLNVVNGQKSFSRLSLKFTEEHYGTAYLTAEYSAIPSYHIRHLWDVDTSEYRSCDFTKHGFRVTMGSDRSLPVDLVGSFKYEAYLYDWDFIEYDSKASTYGIRAIMRPNSRVRVDVGYAIRRSVARGYDEPGETRATSDDSDTTYDQNEYMARVRWGAGRWWGKPAAVTLRGRLVRRFYLTEKHGADDPFHAGREDTVLTLSARGSLGLGDGAALEGFVEHRSRWVDSPVIEDIGELKDYGAWRVGVKAVLKGVRILD
jgi:hypothetical protein